VGSWNDEPAFRLVNPRALRAASPAASSCGPRETAPVCANGEEDVTCSGERYRGCALGATDCADGENGDDKCCWGVGPGPGDNIDHEFCRTNDAGWGGTCFYWDTGHGPPELY
jgi:hypothetical protein